MRLNTPMGVTYSTSKVENDLNYSTRTEYLCSTQELPLAKGSCTLLSGRDSELKEHGLSAKKSCKAETQCHTHQT